MISKERFKAICNFERKNDPFIWSGAWYETLVRWAKEGMPVENLDKLNKEANMHLLGYRDEFEMIAPSASVIGTENEEHTIEFVAAVDPPFEPKVISEDDEYITKVDYDGIVVKRRKHLDTSIPQYIDFPVKDKKTWEEYKKRLDPHSPGRWPEGWEIMTEDKLAWPVKKEMDGKHLKYRDFPLGMMTVSLYINPRQYMGVENLSIATHDNLSLVLEMMDWQAYMAMEMIKKIYATGVYIDFAWIPEDIAYKNASLISPAFVKKYMIPRYKPIIELLRNNGCSALILDSDGNTEELIPLWIESGINAHFPLERAAGMDALKLRKKYGRDLIIIGNIDKREMAKGKAEIDNELERVRELLKYGGYIPFCDHMIPPDVPYKNIVYLYNQLRKMDIHTDNPMIIEIDDPLE